jgi:hypothetical protein
MVMAVYIAESTLLRAEKLKMNKGEEKSELVTNCALITLHEAVEKVQNEGRIAISSFAESDELRIMLIGLKRFTKIDPLNLKEIRRSVARHFIEKNKYVL